ncbi:hypothetical protein [Pediococcus damnosus]|uniref:DUF4179 domain-containing protein n=1 Tax=Pediococcus damnosus TaxID=51663 RepID=A0AAC9B2K8_9LACO|nr:hypothetical protein [Pediococcus damnosus]AMV62956.1 Hypothetical protein ADU70_1472 [Pediococcus damnosus]KJU74845.1 hypothetical protein AH70_04560 [Pediococcus damnosus LMG 28219]PIO81064.1 hypothetical protein BSQ38_05080 [Pediococcus damnosus]PIO85447.1 hypothetical protein BSQ37_05630 [Pediococcus damnosus]PJE49478.1 hypothetical protein BSQ36_05810 [Pediococcus damnosus]
MNIKWRQETDKIEVPKTAVTRAITQGLDQATQHQRHHRRLGLIITVAALLCITLFNPLTIQAGGVVPAIHQLLDKNSQKTHNYDPTMNKIFGDLSDVSSYQSVSSSTVKVDGLKIQIRGVMMSAGIKAFVVDYRGAHINPAALRRQDVQVTLNQHQSVIDLEQNYGQVALGHYRQFVAFYVNDDTSPRDDSIDIHIGHVNGSSQNVSLPTIKTKALPVTVHKITAKVGNSTVGQGSIDQIDTTPHSFVLNYSVSFDQQKVTKKTASLIRKAAWVSEADVIVNKKKIGDLMLGSSGTKVDEYQKLNQVTTKFQSIFASQCYVNSKGKYVAIRSLNPNAIVRFKLEIPGHNSHDRVLGYLRVPINSLIP